MTDTYIPGVCNLNGAETKRRKRIAVIGAVLYVFLFINYVFVQDMYLLRLLLFFPAFIASIGYFQAKSHFCVAYGLSGKSNAEEGSKTPIEVADKDALAKDKAFSRKLFIKASGTSLIFVAIALVCPPYNF